LEQKFFGIVLSQKRAVEKKLENEIKGLKAENNFLRGEIETCQQKLEGFQLLKNLFVSFDGSLEAGMKHLSELVGEKAEKMEALESLMRKMTDSLLESRNQREAVSFQLQF
jgi:hypothetical protein